MRKLLRIRDARIFLAGWTLSQFGDWAMIIVLAVWAKACTRLRSWYFADRAPLQARNGICIIVQPR